MQKLTKPTKSKEIQRAWHLIDVKGSILGRSATEIAKLIMGKSKPYFNKNLDNGDYVVVINAKDVKTTGRKEKLKVYTRYSGYPGGLRRESLEELRARKPEEIVRHAVSGMLPKNRLRDKMLKRLYIFSTEEHKFADKLGKAEV